MIIDNMGRGVTIYSGKRGFGKTGEAKEVDIVYTVVTRLELNKLNIEIEKIDPNAFVVMSSIKDTKGGNDKKKTFKTLTQQLMTRTPAGNSTLPKVAVLCFVGQFCGYINFSASYESEC